MKSLRIQRPGLWLAMGLGMSMTTGCGAQQAQVAAPPQMSWSVSSAALSLMVPVAGVHPTQVPDTFFAPRSGGRVHQASDIPAPEGTPVVSADDGMIARFGQNRLGGNMIYALDAAGHYVYYYAHLQRFADGLYTGQRVRRGEVLGYVGSTGNASPDAPHLHFQLMLRPADGSIHGGPPIDPRPVFALPGEISL